MLEHSRLRWLVAILLLLFEISANTIDEAFIVSVEAGG
jgi:hypothetical protein